MDESRILILEGGKPPTPIYEYPVLLGRLPFLPAREYPVAGGALGAVCSLPDGGIAVTLYDRGSVLFLRREDGRPFTGFGEY